MKNIKRFEDFVNEARYQADEELDRILDKIAEQGIDSITPQEKAYLDGERAQEEPEYDGTYKNDVDFDTMDDNGEFIDPKKENFLFKVYDIDSSDTMFGDIPFGVSAFDKNGKYMIDAHVSDEIFPELKRIGLEDLAEGELEYSGKLSKEELVEKLKSMGFNAIISNRPY